MFRPRMLIGLLSLSLLCSCAAEPAQVQQPAKPAAAPMAAQSKAPVNAAPARNTIDPTPTAPPKGAQYTIFCAKIVGDMHVDTAYRTRDTLKKATGMKDWYVISEPSQSMLYYGYYRVINDASDPKETARAQADRQKIDSMVDGMGNRPFKQALFVELTAPDPSAPPAWNLLNARGDCSLQIAVYKDSMERKEAAVAAVAEARKQGIEAYYYHGPTSSLVCIGSWPKEAYRTVDAPPANGDQPYMVFSESIDDAMAQQLGQSAGNVRVVKPRIEIVDPTLKSAMQQYPYNHVNGMLIKHVVNGKEIFDSSQLVPIPRGTAEAQLPVPGQRQGQPMFDPNRPQLPRLSDPSPQQPGIGQLKSIGD